MAPFWKGFWWGTLFGTVVGRLLVVLATLGIVTAYYSIFG